MQAKRKAKTTHPLIFFYSITICFFFLSLFYF